MSETDEGKKGKREGWREGSRREEEKKEGGR